MRYESIGAFDGGTLIGAAHYLRAADDPSSAEISVEVADGHQRAGIGTRLLDQLVSGAHGITRFTATALTENTAILPLARRLGTPAPSIQPGIRSSSSRPWWSRDNTNDLVLERLDLVGAW